MSGLQVTTWSLDLAEGIKFVHGLVPKIIHRDIKPDNVLLDVHLRCAFVCAKVSGGLKDFSMAFLFIIDTVFRRALGCARTGKLGDFGLSKTLGSELVKSKR